MTQNSLWRWVLGQLPGWLALAVLIAIQGLPLMGHDPLAPATRVWLAAASVGGLIFNDVMLELTRRAGFPLVTPIESRDNGLKWLWKAGLRLALAIVPVSLLVGTALAVAGMDILPLAARLLPVIIVFVALYLFVQATLRRLQQRRRTTAQTRRSGALTQ